MSIYDLYMFYTLIIFIYVPYTGIYDSFLWKTRDRRKILSLYSPLNLIKFTMCATILIKCIKKFFIRNSYQLCSKIDFTKSEYFSQFILY